VLVKSKRGKNMSYQMLEMNETYAKKIMNWEYEGAHSIYNLENNEETLKELLQMDYYAVLSPKGCLVGFFCINEAATVPQGNAFHVYDNHDYVDIGLAMNPKLVGKRKGYAFLRFGLDYFKKHHKINHFRLTVLDFNKQAIHIYHQAGFKIENYFNSINEHYFLVMTLID